MGIELAIAALAGVGAAGVAEQRKARKTAEKDAAQQREALAALEAEPVAPIPTADDATVQRAKRRSISGQLRRRGRASTILTDKPGGDTLGA